MIAAKTNQPLINQIFVKKKKPASAPKNTERSNDGKKICWLLKTKS